jgi:hypothetical protein
VSQRRLTQQEQEHAAVLRVQLMRSGPEVRKVEVLRADVAVVLAALDRLAQAPLVEAVQVAVFLGQSRGSSMANAGTVNVRESTNADGAE